MLHTHRQCCTPTALHTRPTCSRLLRSRCSASFSLRAFSAAASACLALAAVGSSALSALSLSALVYSSCCSRDTTSEARFCRGQEAAVLTRGRQHLLKRGRQHLQGSRGRRCCRWGSPQLRAWVHGPQAGAAYITPGCWLQFLPAPRCVRPWCLGVPQAARGSACLVARHQGRNTGRHELCWRGWRPARREASTTGGNAAAVHTGHSAAAGLHAARQAAHRGLLAGTLHRRPARVPLPC
jgi:hypothetical protein